MNYYKDRPLVVQSDFTVLLEAKHPDFEEVRGTLARFADLVKSPEHIHTYRISPLTIWNAAAAGCSEEESVTFLQNHAKLDIPKLILDEIRQSFKRYGMVLMEAAEDREDELLLTIGDPELLKDLLSYPSLEPYRLRQVDSNRLQFPSVYRGTLKQELTRLGFPVEDAAGYHQGEFLDVSLRTESASGHAFRLREYQQEAADSFYRSGRKLEGSGVLVLPCGAGKTVVGITAMSRTKCATLILTTNVTSVRQWKREILDKTGLTEREVGEYAGSVKEVRPVTIATYQILTYRKSKDDAFVYMNLFNERDWGLIIYDEVHLLPAPVFRVTADIQATRRLGLTATLVREDGRQEDVFSLVGPKRYDMPWKELQRQGWIADVECSEILVGLPDRERDRYAASEPKQQIRIAGENPLKAEVVLRLVEKHQGQPTLIIGQYLDQLKKLAYATGAPMISGEMPHEAREAVYSDFKSGAVKLLVVSKVANFAVDLPDAKVAIQVSGSFGSRQEEAQRLGRILRPKPGDNKGYFYSLVSKDTKEHDFAVNRQLFFS